MSAVCCAVSGRCLLRAQEQYKGVPSVDALFSFVRVDPKTKKGAPVPQLSPSTPEAKRVFAERQRLADERRAARQAPGAADEYTGGPVRSQQWARK